VIKINSKIIITLKSSAIILATLVFYWQDLNIILNEALKNEITTHIILIPFLFTYLVYRKRKMLKAVITFENDRKINDEIFGPLICLLAILLYWYGSYTFQPLEYHLLSLPIFISGTILILYNTETLKTLIFPIAFLLFLIPPPTEIAYTTGAHLATFSTQIAYNILKTIGLPVTLNVQYQSPVILLQSPSGSTIPFAVDVACSGIYSLIGFTVFAFFIAYISRGPIWKKPALFILGFPLIYALNILRITIIVIIGYWQGPELALNIFHLLGGWTLIFLGTLTLLIVSEKIFKIQILKQRFTTKSCSYCNKNLREFCHACGKLLKLPNLKLMKRDILKIALLTLTITLILSIQVPVFALTQGPAEVLTQSPIGGQASTLILPTIEGYNLRFVYRDVNFEKISKQDASLLYQYNSIDRSKADIWIGIEVADSRGKLHRWVTWPQTHGEEPSVTTVNMKDTQLLENPPIIGRFFAFHPLNSNRTQVILYWYENTIFKTESGYQNKHVKISLITFVDNPSQYKEAEEALLPIGNQIVKYWQPLKTWSWITLTIAQNGPALITLTIIPLVISGLYQIIKNQREKKDAQKLFKRIKPKEERLILKAVQKSNKEGKATGLAIASAYKELTGKPIEIETLTEKLEEAEKAGLIKRKISNLDDEPIQIWKNRASFNEQ